jgi:uncharacterized protein (DUF983 family)
MPERVIHCRNCRTLLNTDLEPDSVEIPEFIPLQEIESVAEIPLRGFYVLCPHCTRELRVNRKFADKQVTCKQCGGEFVLELSGSPPKVRKVGLYVYCPHCNDRLRMSPKYLGVKVACKSCTGRLITTE